MGHSISLHEPFTLTRLGEDRYACSGTPADCAIAGITWAFGEAARPQLVLSGINDGRNVGEDIAYSGTMAIAREASFWGIPAIAFSAPKDADFTVHAGPEWLESLIRRFAVDVASWHEPDTWLSINFPTTIPARFRHAVPGRAKIAPGVVVQSGDADQTVLRYSNGRRGEDRVGDDTSGVAAGFATICRLRWNANDALAESLLRELNGALCSEVASARPS